MSRERVSYEPRKFLLIKRSLLFLKGDKKGTARLIYLGDWALYLRLEYFSNEDMRKIQKYSRAYESFMTPRRESQIFVLF